MSTPVSKEDVQRAYESGALRRNLAHFARPKGPDLLKRTEPFFAWEQCRRQSHVWPYSRSLDAAPKTETSIKYDDGQVSIGMNFASQDYLSLASHPSVAEGAIRALRDFGPHSAGSPVLLGNTTLSLRLEAELGETLQTEHVTLFPTGWAAGFGSIVALVRPSDYILIDELAHASLRQGATAATSNIVSHNHIDIPSVRQHLQRIRSSDSEAGILVITEGLFSMDSDVPDLAQLQETCSEYGARLLVDIAHDFGAIGPRGTGSIGHQQMLGKIDLVMGSFSKTFASNGGFLASHSPAVKQYVKYYGGPHTFSNAISPIQVGVVREALQIVRSAEGDALRSHLMTAVNSLRTEFRERGVECIGRPSAIVPLLIGNESLARISSAILYHIGLLVNVVEFPAVSIGASRFRMQLMASHLPEQTEIAARVIADVLAQARVLIASVDSGPRTE